MKTTGRASGFDALLFVAPAAIFIGMWIYMQGGLGDWVKALDRQALWVASSVASWVSGLFS